MSLVYHYGAWKNYTEFRKIISTIDFGTTLEQASQDDV